MFAMQGLKCYPLVIVLVAHVVYTSSIVQRSDSSVGSDMGHHPGVVQTQVFRRLTKFNAACIIRLPQIG